MSAFSLFLLKILSWFFAAPLAMLKSGSSYPKGYIDLGSSATAFAFDGSKANCFRGTLTGNAVITFSNLKPGEIYALQLLQDGVGGWVPTFAGGDLPVSQRPFVPIPTANVSTTLIFMALFESGANFAFASLSISSSQAQVSSAIDLTLECGATKSIILQEDGAEARALNFTDADPTGLGTGPVLSCAAGTLCLRSSTVCLFCNALGECRIKDGVGTNQLIVGTGTIAIGNSSADVCSVLATIGTGAGYIPRYSSKTQTTVGAAGAATALPAQPTGYFNIFIGGTERVIPFYAQA